jgi:Fe-S cluster assembly protein SufD
VDTLARILADYTSGGTATGAAAAHALGERGLPTARDENWRHARLHALNRVPGFGAAGTAGADPAASLPEPLPGFQRLVLHNGRRVAAGSDAAAIAAPRPAPDGDALPPAADTAFDLLNRMFAPQAQSLDLADGARLEILSIATPSGSGAAYARLHLQIAPGARVQLVERHLGGCGALALVCPSVAVSVGPGATLDHYRLQQCTEDALFLETLSGELAADASWNVRTASCGAATARTTALLRLGGADAALDWQSLAIAHHGQTSDLLLRVEHAAPRTRTQQQYRGIATEQGHAACSAEMRVSAQAPGARITQSLRGLLEGSRSEIDLRPRLEIHTDEVQAAHGATTGRLDENLLFYLLSRGIEPDTARALLRWAFLGDVLRHWSIPELRRTAERAAAGLLGTSVPEGPA